MSQPWGTCRKRRNVTHHTQEEGQTGPENSLYPNILFLFLCFLVEEPGLRTGRWARNKTPNEGANKELQKQLFISNTKYFLYPKLVLSQSRSLKIEPETMLCFGFPYLVFITIHSSRPEREMKQRMTERHFLKPSLAVIMACLLSLYLWQLLNHQWENTGSILALSVWPADAEWAKNVSVCVNIQRQKKPVVFPWEKS